MSAIPFAFGFPIALFALALLPVIWWLNRLTPPKPTQEPFAPFEILAKVLKKEDTPAKSPWWLTLLRVLLAAIIIFALAEPILNPREERLVAQGPVLLVVDNSWASAPDWQQYQDTANAIINEAEDNDLPVIIAQSTSLQNDLSLGTADQARQVLASFEPIPIQPYQSDIVASIETALSGRKIDTAVILTQNVEAENTSTFFQNVLRLEPNRLEFITPDNSNLVGITSARNESTSVTVDLTRLSAQTATSFKITGYDIQSRPIVNGSVQFEIGEQAKTADLAAPFELLNDVVRLSVEKNKHAAGSYLLDDRFQRRKIALFSGETQDLINPLLTPSHYIQRAAQPFADFINVTNADLTTGFSTLIEQGPSALILSDIGNLDADVEDELVQWIENGGTLIRFAGASLAATSSSQIGDDPLLPVRLRSGERQFGGSLTWAEPKSLAPFAQSSPYFGIELSNDIVVKRQVLAEPSLDLADNTWASLDDGTPLVTAKSLGSGRIVLFHISAETTWSNLPLTGEFAEMLRRTIALSHSAASSDTNASQSTQTSFLPAFRTLTADGTLETADGSINPLEITPSGAVVENQPIRPGLFGSQDGWRAVNLLEDGDLLQEATLPDAGMEVTTSKMTLGSAFEFKSWLLLIALIMLIIDALIIMFMSGAFSRLRMMRSNLFAVKASLILCAVLSIGLIGTNESLAQDNQVGDAEIIAKLQSTQLAYVITGDRQIDRISELGLNGLNFYLKTRTALEPSPSAGLDLETDELSFHPLIYWPISETAPMPSKQAMSNIENFMKRGGTVLFDTRDAISNISLNGSASMRTQRLRQILDGLIIPALEPVPADHVLTKTFYLLDKFPGRYSGGELWVEALRPETSSDNQLVNGGDGVSPIMITSNDFAGAWAMDASRRSILPMVPPNDRQRTLAFRSGVNIVMYMLTGNYKADQVHLPALLERLGQ